MNWLLIILISILYIIWKFNKDSKKIQAQNISKGGLLAVFPEFVNYFENNDFQFVEDTGAKIIFKQKIHNSTFEKFLFIGIESKFTNIAFGYIVTNNGRKINGLRVEFKHTTNMEEIEMIIRKITGNFQLNGYL
ncbi:hypothetical protein QQ054_27075 [Oscillatoria amoena NRMC-F 0135]|nr:hypothetical protein [Oscillatoria amoena NRMC-F 0135]